MFLFELKFLSFVPDERIGLLIFGVALVLLAIGLRRFMKRSEMIEKSEIQHITQ